ncbi:MAG: hypothetical protein P4L98_19180 [Ancalomicrobiaceae bacterium]|nr:hypothetical protein [Ancalomicrobiaceae bacterium]
MQSKVSSLIDSQVSSGALTSSQASELKQVFQQTFSGDSTTPGVQGAHHGHHHHGGDAADVATLGSDTATSTDPTTTSSTTAASTTSASTATDTTQKLVDQFIRSLQQSASTSYGQAGTTNTADLSSLLLNVGA